MAPTLSAVSRESDPASVAIIRPPPGGRTNPFCKKPATACRGRARAAGGQVRLSPPVSPMVRGATRCGACHAWSVPTRVARQPHTDAWPTRRVPAGHVTPTMSSCYRHNACRRSAGAQGEYFSGRLPKPRIPDPDRPAQRQRGAVSRSPASRLAIVRGPAAGRGARCGGGRDRAGAARGTRAGRVRAGGAPGAAAAPAAQRAARATRACLRGGRRGAARGLRRLKRLRSAAGRGAQAGGTAGGCTGGGAGPGPAQADARLSQSPAGTLALIRDAPISRNRSPRIPRLIGRLCRCPRRAQNKISSRARPPRLGGPYEPKPGASGLGGRARRRSSLDEPLDKMARAETVTRATDTMTAKPHGRGRGLAPRAPRPGQPAAGPGGRSDRPMVRCRPEASGFVSMAGRSGDAFPARARAEQWRSYTTVASGASLRVRLGQGPEGTAGGGGAARRGRKHRAAASAPLGPALRRVPFGGASRGPAPTGGEEVRGTVKWFDQSQGLRLRARRRPAATCSCAARFSPAAASSNSARARPGTSCAWPRAPRNPKPPYVRLP